MDKNIIQNKLDILKSLRPIKPEYLSNILDKFRIEYNYHSNHIEGNSLTLSETYSFIKTGLIGSDKIRKKIDYDEMEGHNKTIDTYNLLDSIKYIDQEIKTENIKITHQLIKEINKLLLVEDHKKWVKDEKGNDHQVDVIVGQYKGKNNHVLRKNGEKFMFAEWTSVQIYIQDLIDWYNREANNLDPISLAAIFHYKFIRIHPFDDGNGRTARILCNMILMNHGYPIIIIPSDAENKQEYYNVLEITDLAFGDLADCVNSTEYILFDEFTKYIYNRVNWSLDQVIAGARGENIFDVGDIIKKFKLGLAKKEIDGAFYEMINKDKKKYFDIYIKPHVEIVQKCIDEGLSELNKYTHKHVEYKGPKKTSISISQDDNIYNKILEKINLIFPLPNDNFDICYIIHMGDYEYEIYQNIYINDNNITIEYKLNKNNYIISGYEYIYNSNSPFPDEIEIAQKFIEELQKTLEFNFDYGSDF